MATSSSILAWRIPWTEEPGGLKSTGFQRKFGISAKTRLKKSNSYFLRIKLPTGEGNGTPLQYSCLENPMDRGAWKAAVHGVAKSQARHSDFTLTFHFHTLEKEMATHSSVLAWRIQGRGSLVGCHLWGRTESDTTEAT